MFRLKFLRVHIKEKILYLQQQFIRLSYDTPPEKVILLLGRWQHKQPVFSLCFYNKHNYQRLVQNQQDEIPFFNTRPLWVITDGLDLNQDLAFPKQTSHHPKHIGILSDEILENLTERIDLCPSNRFLKMSEDSILNRTCDVFLFIDKGPLESNEKALTAFKASLVNHLASSKYRSSFQFNEIYSKKFVRPELNGI